MNAAAKDKLNGDNIEDDIALVCNGTQNVKRDLREMRDICDI